MKQVHVQVGRWHARATWEGAHIAQPCIPYLAIWLTNLLAGFSHLQAGFSHLRAGLEQPLAVEPVGRGFGVWTKQQHNRFAIPCKV